MPEIDGEGRAVQHGGMQPSRHVPLQGASNFRDFGGYPAAEGRTVKWRRLFRSDRLSDLTPADYEALDAYGIRAVYDLRRDSEAAAAPTRWGGKTEPELIRSALFTDEPGRNIIQHTAADGVSPDADLARRIMSETYARMVSEPGALAVLGAIFARLTTADAFPALFHCAAGKDRTGVTCALILSALGVAREDVVEDFMLTQQYYDTLGNLERNVSQVVDHAGSGWSREALLPMFGVERVYIETALDVVHAEGGIETFLAEKLGVPFKGLTQLREQLLD